MLLLRLRDDALKQNLSLDFRGRFGDECSIKKQLCKRNDMAKVLLLNGNLRADGCTVTDLVVHDAITMFPDGK